MSDVPSDRDDPDIAAALAGATLPPADDFRRTLRSELVAAADDDVTIVHPARGERSRRVWPLLSAAAAVVALVVGLTVAGVRRDGADVDPAAPPTIEPTTEIREGALTDDELVSELSDRRWLALERFDDPSPSPLVSVVTVTGTPDDPRLVAHDGCASYGGPFQMDGTTITTTQQGSDLESAGCSSEVVRLTAGHRIELLPDANEFTLRADDGTAIAVFTDIATLAPADPPETTTAWPLDAATSLAVTGTGRASLGCTVFGWTTADDTFLLTLDERQPDCSIVGDEPLRPGDPYELALAEVTSGVGAEILATADGVVITNGDRAILVRGFEPATVDPDGVTIAAGMLFGVRTGLGVTPDELIQAIEPVLGPPEFDSGWIDERDQVIDRPTPRCELSDYRELVWGDLVAGFWGRGSRTMFDHWYVGDQRILGLAKPAVERPELEPLGLETEHGVAVGDTGDTIPDRFDVERFDWEGEAFPPGTDVELVVVVSSNPTATGSNLEPGVRRGVYLVIDGTVAAYGSADGGCH